MRSTCRPGTLAAQRAGQVGRRVGGAQVHVVARARPGPAAMAAAIVVLPTPPLPMTMIRPCPAAASSSTSAARPGRVPAVCAGGVGARRRRRRRPDEQRAQGRQADHVEGAQRHLVPRQRAQAPPASPPGACCPAPRRRTATASARSLAWNTPLTTRRWLRKPERPQLARGARRLARGAARSGRVTSTIRWSAPDRPGRRARP